MKKALSAAFLLLTAQGAYAAGFAVLQTVSAEDVKTAAVRAETPVPMRDSLLKETNTDFRKELGEQGTPAEVKAERSAKSIRLQATDGSQIVVEYTAMDLGGSVIANPFWITVTNKAFRGNEQVRVTLMTYYEATASSADALKGTEKLDLIYNGSAFRIKGPDMSIYEGHHAWSLTFRQEIAVSVNGLWLTDPVNGTHNFKFKLTK
jgi:hypothetical protein